MKYVFHTAGEIRDAYDFVTNFEGMTFEAEIEAGRLDKHAYDNLAVLLDFLWRINSDGTEENVGAVETGREEPCRRPCRGL